MAVAIRRKGTLADEKISVLELGSRVCWAPNATDGVRSFEASQFDMALLRQLWMAHHTWTVAFHPAQHLQHPQIQNLNQPGLSVLKLTLCMVHSWLAITNCPNYSGRPRTMEPRSVQSRRETGAELCLSTRCPRIVNNGTLCFSSFSSFVFSCSNSFLFLYIFFLSVLFSSFV